MMQYSRSLLKILLAFFILFGVSQAVDIVQGDSQEIIVDSKGDEPDLTADDGICLTAMHTCTLRAAIEQANADASTADLITFDIPTYLHIAQKIDISEQLPTISTPMTIQGPNDSHDDIVLDGQDGSFSGLVILGENISIIKLQITNFGDNGILISNANNIFVSDCLIGSNYYAPTFPGNGHRGIEVENSTGVNIINNLISSNGEKANETGQGIRIVGGSSNVIQGNIVGANLSGLFARPNPGGGIEITNSNANLIGGELAVERNLVSGNGWYGIAVLGNASGNIVYGNYIGTDYLGETAIPNEGPGIVINGAERTRIGGIGNGEGNIISGNLGDGIVVYSTSNNNEIIGNSIFENVGLGINLLQEGEDPSTVTLNDIDDSDIGANHLQNFPILTRIGYSNGGTSIAVEGTLNSRASEPYIIHFYGNKTCDPSGFGEGQVYLGEISVETDSIGDATFTKIISSSDYFRCITATATDIDGNTSEFSSNEYQFRFYLPLFEY